MLTFLYTTVYITCNAFPPGTASKEGKAQKEEVEEGCEEAQEAAPEEQVWQEGQDKGQGQVKQTRQ